MTTEAALVLEEVDEVGSTSEALKQRLGDGERALLARRQTAGRGRMGRAWQTGDGNLFLSVLLRPAAPIAPGHWSLLAAVALAETVRRFVPETQALTLKWPNDLLLDGGKLAGILLDAGDDGAPWLIAGFGVNLVWAPEVPGRSTACLAPHAPPPPRTMAAALLEVLDAWRTRYGREGFAPVRDGWLAFGPRPGAAIAAQWGGRAVEGRFRGIGSDGALLLDGPAGPLTVTSGEVL